MLPKGPGAGARGGGRWRCLYWNLNVLIHVTMSPPEGRGGGDMLPFAPLPVGTGACWRRSLSFGRVLSPPPPTLPWASPRASLKGILGPIFLLPFLLPRASPRWLTCFTGEIHFPCSLLVKLCLFLALEYGGGRVGGPVWTNLPWFKGRCGRKQPCPPGWV